MHRPLGIVAGVAVAAVLTGGCADASQLGPGTTAAAGGVEGPASGSATGDDAAPDPATDGRWVTVFDEPPTYEQDGVTLRVTGLGVTDATHDTAVPGDIAGFLDEQVRTVLVLEVEVENRSGATVSVFPHLAEIQVRDERSKAKALLSDTVGHELGDGGEDAGVVLWTLTHPFEQVLDAGELVLDASPPIEAGSREPVGEPIVVTVGWDPPER